ncbi:MAG: hypothetical protein JKY31_02485 [Rhodobacteraceae bacterium]|nr:hypothetical protein [Paracoccaceae bacterium]
MLPSITAAKQLAAKLRAQLNTEGREIGHSKSLELVAVQFGYRDWNTFHAAIGNRPPNNWALGDHVSGHYLSQPFTAKIIAISMVRNGWFEMTLDLDEAVDVVTFDSFSNFRKRIRKIVGPQGTTLERTSDGQPHLVLAD